MKKNQQEELMMNEISVKSLEEISGGAINLSGLVTTIGGIISRPTTGMISKPRTTGMISKPNLPTDITSLK